MKDMRNHAKRAATNGGGWGDFYCIDIYCYGQRVKSWVGKSRTLENQAGETVNEV